MPKMTGACAFGMNKPVVIDAVSDVNMFTRRVAH